MNNQVKIHQKKRRRSIGCIGKCLKALLRPKEPIYEDIDEVKPVLTSSPKCLNTEDIRSQQLSGQSTASPMSSDKSYKHNAILEITDTEAVGGKVFQDYRGMIRLAIDIVDNFLSVSVLEAKDLSFHSTFVQVSMIDEVSESDACHTSIVRNTTRPVYDERFTYELIPDDYYKRLFVTMWSSRAENKDCEFIGCTSYGIQSIVENRNTVNGWYYVLDDGLGERKHMAVKNKGQYSFRSDSSGYAASSYSSHSNQSSSRDSGYQSASGEVLDVIIQQGVSGYGMTLNNGAPVQVDSVTNGSPAQLAGLKQGDYIVSVNNHDVTTMYPHTLIQILQHYNGKVSLKVQRNNDVSFSSLNDKSFEQMLMRNVEEYFQKESIAKDSLSCVTGVKQYKCTAL